jgi:hypothetical protein
MTPYQDLGHAEQGKQQCRVLLLFPPVLLILLIQQIGQLGGSPL